MKRSVCRMIFFAAILMSVLFCGITAGAAEKTRVITVENGEAEIFYTEETDEKVIYEEFFEKLDLCEYDDVTFKKRGENYVFNIKRSYKVYIQVGKKTHTVRVLNETVETAIARAGFTLGEEDTVSKPLDRKLRPNDTVILQQVTYRMKETTKELPFSEEHLRTACLADGKKVKLVEGKNGTVTERVTERLINGVLDSSTSETLVTTAPVNAVWLVGDSSLKFNETELPSFLTLNDKGEPESYQYKITGKGTAYYAPPGARTATGVAAAVGRVAVDPAEIPYGSLLYIASADGKFVYGFAIACDTGSALYAGNVVADLYFETYDECCNFGARKVNVFVLS